MNALPLPMDANDDSFERLVAAAQGHRWPPAEVARLATHLAQSGDRLEWGAGQVADVASTGGPGSLSTLIAPLFLRVRGASIVKLAVPGRPAGAIDALGTVPGYRVRSSPVEIRRAIDRCGYAHFLADRHFAPLDAALFAYRRRTNAVAVPALATASLLAKKLAVGVRFVGLDVRAGSHGNFGATLAEARENAVLFCEAARMLGIRATAFLSAGVPPAQPWLGRGESLAALASVAHVCEQTGPCIWLTSHVRDCCSMATKTLSASQSADSTGNLSPDQLRAALGAHLVAHGSTLEAFRERAERVISAERTILVAPEDGVLTVDLAAVRDALVHAQADHLSGCFLDPAGVELLVRPGVCVKRGQPLARVRSEDALVGEPIIPHILAALRVLPPESLAARALGCPSDRAPLEVIRA